jgi:hypothetical protein
VRSRDHEAVHMLDGDVAHEHRPEPRTEVALDDALVVVAAPLLRSAVSDPVVAEVAEGSIGCRRLPRMSAVFSNRGNLDLEPASAEIAIEGPERVKARCANTEPSSTGDVVVVR